MSCNVLFESAWELCCETNTSACLKLADKASNIQCLISKASSKGKYFVIVNKCELWDEDGLIIQGLRDACYVVEFLPNSDFGGGTPRKYCGCDEPANPEETEQGYYKISWTVCQCNSASSSCCCEDLPSSCTSSSLSCECLPGSSSSAACELL